MDSPGSPIVFVVAAVAVSVLGSFFAAGDAALLALPEAHLEQLRAEPGQRGDLFRRYAEDRSRVLSRWLVGRIVCASLAAALFGRAVEHVLASTPLALLGAAVGAVLSYGTFAEILVTIARRRPERVAALSLSFVRVLGWLVIPLAEPLAILGRFVGRRFARRPADPRLAETEVEWIVTQGEKSGAIGNEPAEMIRNVLEFKDRTAHEVMVPRRRISAIDVNTPLDRVLAKVAAEGHSRYPVYRETLDNVVGLLYAKDLFALVKERRTTGIQLSSLVRTPVLFVVETQPILSILREMRAGRLHMAVVSDEFGGTSGIITLEDVIEEIVGEIRDEYDTDAEAQIQELGDGRLVADAAVPLADLAERLGHELPAGEFDSLGGLLIERAGRVPEVGATLQLDGLKFIVREADETRVVKVEIVPAGDTPAAPVAATGS